MTEDDKVLQDFFRSYYAWLWGGAPEGGFFDRDVGLCGNYNRYWYCYIRGSFEDHADRIATKLKDDFPNAFDYPFGLAEYERRYINHTLHLDPNRQAYVIDNLV